MSSLESLDRLRRIGQTWKDGVYEGWKGTKGLDEGQCKGRRALSE